jgi:hypothetical protein
LERWELVLTSKEFIAWMELAEGEKGFRLDMRTYHYGDTVVVFPSWLQYDAADLLLDVGDDALEHGLVLIRVAEEVGDMVVMETADESLCLLFLSDVLDGAIVVEGELKLADNVGSALPSLEDGQFR